jgi:hypothetical protein
MGYRIENIPERNCKRYFAQDSSGQDLFFIELIDAGFPEYFFSSSLPGKIFEQPDLIKLRQLISGKTTSEPARRHFIEKLFKIIWSLPEAKNIFFKKHVLTKFGKYSEELARTLESIIFNHELQILTSYSPHRNEEIFSELQKGHDPHDDRCSVLLAEKELFEENLVNDDLRFGYVEVYSDRAKYYFEQEKIENTLIEYYFMTVDDKLVFLFLVSFFEE